MEHATQSALSKSSLKILPISDNELEIVYGGMEGDTPEGNPPPQSAWSRMWGKAEDKLGEGLGMFLWLVPTLIVTEIIKWHINKKIKKYEKRRKREKLERRKANLANAD